MDAFVGRLNAVVKLYPVFSCHMTLYHREAKTHVDTEVCKAVALNYCQLLNGWMFFCLMLSICCCIIYVISLAAVWKKLHRMTCITKLLYLLFSTL